MAKIVIRQLKTGQTFDLPPEFWQMLENLPKFKKIGKFTQLTSTN